MCGSTYGRCQNWPQVGEKNAGTETQNESEIQNGTKAEARADSNPLPIIHNCFLSLQHISEHRQLTASPHIRKRM